MLLGWQSLSRHRKARRHLQGPEPGNLAPGAWGLCGVRGGGATPTRGDRARVPWCTHLIGHLRPQHSCKSAGVLCGKQHAKILISIDLRLLYRHTCLRDKPRPRRHPPGAWHPWAPFPCPADACCPGHATAPAKPYASAAPDRLSPW